MPTNRLSQDKKQQNNSFWLHMYDQAWNNVNRHILTVWQSVAAVGASISVVIGTSASVIDVDVAVALVILLAGWLLSHVYDAQQWFDRNMGIIIRAEKHFETFEGEFHSYTKPRKFKLIGHMRIQRDLSLLLIVVGLAYHFIVRVLVVCMGKEIFFTEMFLPYIALVAIVGYLSFVRSEWKKGFKKAYQD